MSASTSLRRIRSVKGPVTLFVISLCLVVALLVLWNVVLAVDYQRIRALAARATEQGGAAFHGTFIALGSALFVATIAIFSILGAQLIQEIRFSQRLSNLLATFTHELNSPLASIKLFGQTLRRARLPREEEERFLDMILADVERLRGQISNVLRAAQAQSRPGIHVAPETLDLVPYLAEYAAARRPSIERSEERSTLELVPGPTARVGIDRQLFRQVLDNLVDNAQKFARPGGVAIRIATAEGSRPSRIAIEVRDDGCGIGARDLERIFRPFARAEVEPQAKRRPGTGLGLWIVRLLVEAHGGTAAARSPGVGQGATIVIELPSIPEGPDARDPAERAGTPDATDPCAAPPAPPGARP